MGAFLTVRLNAVKGGWLILANCDLHFQVTTLRHRRATFVHLPSHCSFQLCEVGLFSKFRASCRICAVAPGRQDRLSRAQRQRRKSRRLEEHRPKKQDPMGTRMLLESAVSGQLDRSVFFTFAAPSSSFRTTSVVCAQLQSASNPDLLLIDTAQSGPISHSEETR